MSERPEPPQRGRVDPASENATGTETLRGGAVDVGSILAARLYAARLRFDYTYTGISCSSAHSPSTVVLGLLIFGPVLILRPRTSPTLQGSLRDPPRSGGHPGANLWALSFSVE